MRRWRVTQELSAIPIAIGVLAIVLAVIEGIWIGFWPATVVTVGLALAVIAALTIWFTRRPVAAPADTPDVRPVQDDQYRALVVLATHGPASELVRALRSRAGGRPISVFVTAPTHESRLERLASDQSGYDDAARRLSDVLETLRAGGIRARAQVGAEDPLQAADDALRQFAADEILFVAAREGQPGRLEGGVLERAGSRYHQRVEQLMVP